MEWDIYEETQKLIDTADNICYDVAREHGQIFDNVKYMDWFFEAVMYKLTALSREVLRNNERIK